MKKWEACAEVLTTHAPHLGSAGKSLGVGVETMLADRGFVLLTEGELRALVGLAHEVPEAELQPLVELVLAQLEADRAAVVDQDALERDIEVLRRKHGTAVIDGQLAALVGAPENGASE